jgi:hypothetical protein
MNDYDAYNDEDDYADGGGMVGNSSTSDMFQSFNEHHRPPEDLDWNDPAIQTLPRILLMGPRRGGKTSIQVRISLFVGI